ncbi:MAG: hypothetical protein ACD_76C00044G0006 [uncultured bacterium]|nr:MAG: hypothetical protein ACD_76C00044G0006 [uncultured bacterium]
MPINNTQHKETKAQKRERKRANLKKMRVTGRGTKILAAHIQKKSR